MPQRPYKDIKSNKKSGTLHFKSDWHFQKMAVLYFVYCIYVILSYDVLKVNERNDGTIFLH